MTLSFAICELERRTYFWVHAHLCLVLERFLIIYLLLLIFKETWKSCVLRFWLIALLFRLVFLFDNKVRDHVLKIDLIHLSAMVLHRIIQVRRLQFVTLVDSEYKLVKFWINVTT